ncbi:MAG: DUF3788 family protein [Myxococcales bacterium]
MTAPFFTDPKHPPAEKEILAALGRAAPAWKALFARLDEEHPGLECAWNYYTDGKSWLLKVTRKAKTVFWLSVEKGAFKVAFYFPKRLAPELLDSGLSKERKAELAASKPVGALLPVPVRFGPKKGVADVLLLVGLKKSLK